MSFMDLKKGDTVIRRMGKDGPSMKMTVQDVGEERMICSAPGTEDWPLNEMWTFDRETGVEEDEELGWGRKFGVTGTYLEREN